MTEENGDFALARIATAESHYDALGLSQLASEEDVKRAYQRAAKACHPDRNSGGAAQRAFIRVQEAWVVLKDPATRRAYDGLNARPENVVSESVLLAAMQFREDNGEGWYFVSCRCGGEYLVSKETVATATEEDSSVEFLVNCNTCSLYLDVAVPARPAAACRSAEARSASGLSP